MPACRFVLPLVVLLMTTMPHVAVAQTSPTAPGQNPFFEEWTTPFGVPPFDQIKAEHFLPAFKEAIAQQRREIEAIASSTAAPTFANTIEALDAAGDLLSKVSAVFGNMRSANTNEQLQAINREVAPMLSALRDDIRLEPEAVRARKTTCGPGVRSSG